VLGSSTEVEKNKYSTVSIFSTSQIGVRTAIRYIEKFDWVWFSLQETIGRL